MHALLLEMYSNMENNFEVGFESFHKSFIYLPS